jgi:hypothetical protein
VAARSHVARGAAAPPPRAPGGRGILVEKIPLFAIAALSSALTFVAQSSAGAVRDLAHHPLALRAATALVAYPAYLASALWPGELSVLLRAPARVSGVAGGRWRAAARRRDDRAHSRSEAAAGAGRRLALVRRLARARDRARADRRSVAR